MGKEWAIVPIAIPMISGESASADTPSVQAALAPARNAALAMSLTALAGFLDAVGYAQLQHLYVSFMSGNSTQLGMALGTARWDVVLAAGGVIGSFVVGAFVGTMVADMSGRFSLPGVLATESILLLAAIAMATLGRPELGLLFVSFAMGSQNTLHQVVAGADVGRSFVTGALFGFGQSLARWARRRSPFGKAAASLVSWTAFVCGVTLGTVVFNTIGLVAALVAGLAFLLLLTAAGVLFFYIEREPRIAAKGAQGGM